MTTSQMAGGKARERYDAPDHFFGPRAVLRTVMTGRSGVATSPGKLRRAVLDLNRRSARCSARSSMDVQGSASWRSDAQAVSSGPIARIKLSHPLPFSFHGWWQPA